MRRAARLVAICAALLLLGPGTGDSRNKGKRTRPGALMTVVTPASRATVSAHPFVNVVVRLDPSADSTTFRARLGSHDITSLFGPATDTNGNQVGLRAKLPHQDLRTGRRRTNRLRLQVQSKHSGSKGHGQRQTVRIRFHAEDRPNQPPTAILDPGSKIIIPGFSIDFDGAQSFDPEGDELTYAWDFGDGGTSTDVDPSHTYASDDKPVTVRLAVSDGQDTGTAADILNACPYPSGNFQPGVPKVTAVPRLSFGSGSSGLEFGAVAPGSTGTLTFTVTNTGSDLVDPNDPTKTTPSVLAVCLAAEGNGFSLNPSTNNQPITLGAQQSLTVTVTFAPTAVGHEAATIAVVTPRSPKQFTAFLAHGYGGSAPGPGPTMMDQVVLYTDLFGQVRGFLPNGTPVNPDTSTYTCFVNGQNEGDICTSDADCAPNGGTCQRAGTCFGGDRDGQPCTTQGDCPNSQTGCSSIQPFDPVEICSDGAGGLYLLSDSGAFTDPNPNDVDEIDVDVARVTLDANANSTGLTIIDHTTDSTAHFACDGFAASAGGRVFLAEDHTVNSPPNCFRSEEESLVAVRKSDGSTQTLMPRIDAAEGLNGCSDDIDNTTFLMSSSDGSQIFASFDTGGLWRIRPTPLQFLDSTYSEDFFRLHPDGSVVFARVGNSGTTATLNVYKVSPDQVATNALPVVALTPCGSFQVPNGLDPNGNPGRSRFDALYVSPTTAGSQDATILATVAANSSDPLAVNATIAFSSPAGSATCTPLGIVNLVDMQTPFSF